MDLCEEVRSCSDVIFYERQPVEEVCGHINSLISPNVILWYIGCHGFRENGVRYYRDHVLSPIYFSNPTAKFWLLDLQAWKAFKCSESSISEVSKYVEAIEAFTCPRIKVLTSASIFSSMSSGKCSFISQMVRDILAYDFVYQSSAHFSPVGIKVESLFPSALELFPKGFSLDASQSYSVFQYIEGCLIIDQILASSTQDRNVEIAFVLPNDELKYYMDAQNSFQQDVERLIKYRHKWVELFGYTVTIRFYAFSYGNDDAHRPYNAPGKHIRTAKFAPHDIISSQEESVCH